MIFTQTLLKGCYTIDVKALEDERGLFARTYCKNDFKETGFNKEFVQFNHSYNRYSGTIRGMHFQRVPFTETKLIRCIQGAAYDVAVDLRADSPTYLQHVAVELSAKNMRSILIPDGFAHGFQALEDNTTLIYHHTQYYTVNADAGLLYNDKVLGIKWPLPAKNLSAKDISYPNIDNTFKGIMI